MGSTTYVHQVYEYGAAGLSKKYPGESQSRDSRRVYLQRAVDDGFVDGAGEWIVGTVSLAGLAANSFHVVSEPARLRVTS